MDQNQGNKDVRTPGWLKTIQLNSWEAELLISALVLYALVQIPDEIREFAYQNFDRDSRYLLFSKILIRAVELLSFGYILHILVRGIWVANIGLSYVFPNGVNHEKLKFKGKFKQDAEKQSSLVNGVLKLEELSSLIYSISFVLFGCLLGFGVFMLVMIALTDSFYSLAVQQDSFFLVPMLGMLFYLVLSLIIFIDFVTNGLFRRTTWAAPIYYPIALVFRVLTFSFLYRRAILVLISNAKGWRSSLIPFIIIIATFSFLQIKKEINDRKLNSYLTTHQAPNLFAANYDDKRKEGMYFIGTLPSEVVDQPVLKVFVKGLNIFGKLHEGDSLNRSNWLQLNSVQSSASLNQWLSLSVDSTEVEAPMWHITQHPQTMGYGFSTFVDLSDIKVGLHTLKIAFDTTSLNDQRKSIIRNSDYSQLTLSNIQFYSSHD